jgi:peptidoglycan/LPS O-acetylase OafA/YrhL
MKAVRRNSRAQVHTGYIPSLYLLRGIAALSVCLFHLICSSHADPSSWLHAVLSRGYLGVYLFFVISGFVIPYSMYTSGYKAARLPAFLLKRSIRIEIPYIAAFHLMILVIYLRQKYNGWPFEFDAERYFLHFFYLTQYFGKEPYSSLFWTLAIEFQFYLLIGILFPLITSRYKALSALVLLGLAVASWQFTGHFAWYVFQYGLLFVAGILAFLYRVGYLPLGYFLGGLLLAGVLTLLRDGIEITCVAVLAPFAILFIRREWKVTNFLGRISYSFYLLHLEGIWWMSMILGPYIKEELPLFAAALAGVLIISTVFYYGVERPAFRLSKRVRYRQQPVKEELVRAPAEIR